MNQIADRGPRTADRKPNMETAIALAVNPDKRAVRSPHAFHLDARWRRFRVRCLNEGVNESSYLLRPIGRVRSALTDRAVAPKQGAETGTEAVVEIFPDFSHGLDGLRASADCFLLTWLHHAERATLRVHPRDNAGNPLTGVFNTRSADRPNPIGLHRVTILAIESDGRLRVRGLEAIEGTPVVDIKPVLAFERRDR
jgi:tRNA-Thr(GGU) m(6)t(6)A37 methyltransferase TsaA